MNVLSFFLVVTCFMLSIMGEIKKRELLPKEKDLFKELRDKLTLLEKRFDSRTCNGHSLNDVGITYTRWGRTKCPKNNTELVYSGYVGGSWYEHRGAAMDYLCMPKNPDWNYKFTEKSSGSKGYVYGAEYQIHEDHIGIDKSLLDHDVPCAVCRVVGSTSALMIPGKTKCQRSWTRQYIGYLMSGHPGHAAASQYICIDKDAEALPRSSDNKNGKLLYPIEAKCGSLPCMPYVEGRELACVVCSK